MRRVLTASELGAAFGRDRIVHAAVGGGKLCRRLLADLEKLAGLRAAGPAALEPAHRNDEFRPELRRKRRTVPKRMTEANEQDANEHEQKRLTLRSGGTLGLRRPVETGQVRQSFSHGRSKAVTVEVRKKRAVPPGTPEPGRAEPAAPPAAVPAGRAAPAPPSAPPGRLPARPAPDAR